MSGPYPVSTADRFLLVRTSALGDIAQSLPTLTALRRAFPAARIGWVIDEDLAPLLAGHALLDQLLPIPLRRWRRSPAGRAGELLRFVRGLRAFRPSVAIDLMSNHKAALITRLSGARRRIGLRAADRREPSSAVWLNELAAARGRHAVERSLSTLAPLGIDGAVVDFGPESLTCGADLVPDGDYFLLHPGAAWPNKRYPVAQWGRVARELAETSGIPVRVGAGPGETELAEAIATASCGQATRLAAPTIPALVGAIRGARLVLAADTGAIHIAHALGRPLVAVHGPTDPELHGPWGAQDAAVFRRLPCSFCHQRMDGPRACLTRLEPEAITRAALAALEAAV